MPKDASTILDLERECKSCVLYKSKNKDEKLTTSVYVLNEAYEKLGKPAKIQVSITAK